MKKILGLSGAVLAVLVLACGGVLVYRLVQFRSAVASLKAQGQPVSFADLNSTSDEFEVDGTEAFNRLAEPLGSFESEMYKDEEVLSRPVDDEMIARFDDLVEAYPTVFPLLEELSKADGLRTELQGDFQTAINQELERVQRLRSCARVLAWKLRVLAAQGKADEALDAGVKIFELCRVFDHQPTMVSRLVRVACHGVAIQEIHDLITQQKVSPEALERLNQQILNRSKSQDYLIALTTERAAGIEFVSERGMFHIAFGGLDYLDTINEEIENCTKQPFEQTFSNADPASAPAGLPDPSGSILPALQQLRMASARNTSLLRALRIISALVANPDSIGKEISQDDLLAMGVPKEMTIDTMTGDPMIVKRRDDRWVVYSVGWNKKDDGGDPQPGPNGDFTLGVQMPE